METDCDIISGVGVRYEGDFKGRVVKNMEISAHFSY